jgi:hypothetical protein
MTVSNQTSRTSATGSAAAGQEIPFSFPIAATSELTVKTRVTATGVEATLDETADYTVSINGDSGGTVTLVDALAATSQVWIIRNTPKTQALDLTQGGAFSAENIEDAFDKNCKLVVNEADAGSRALTIPDTDSASLDMTLPNSVDRASSYLLFDANGEPTATGSVAPSTATVSTYMESVIDDADEATFKATVNLEIGTDVQAYSAYLLAIAALAVTDGNILVGNGTTWVAESGATARTSLGAQAQSTYLDAIAALSKTDGNIIVANGTTFVAESGATARVSLGVPGTDEILTYEGDVLTYEGNVLTYED